MILFRHIARALLIAALMLSIGLHWVVLQSAAWASMMLDFSQRDSLVTAVSKTFDGEHGCPLCHLVDEGSKKDPTAPSKKPSDHKKLDLLVSALVALKIFPPSSSRMPLVCHAEHPRELSLETAKPPPRAGA